MQEILDTKIKDLNLSTRTYNALTKGIGGSIKFENVGELIKADYNELIRIRNLGKVGVKETITAVHMLGLKFDFESDPKNSYYNICVENNIDDYKKMYEVVCNKIKVKQEEIYEKQAELEELYRLRRKIAILSEEINEKSKIYKI